MYNVSLENFDSRKMRCNNTENWNACLNPPFAKALLKKKLVFPKYILSNDPRMVV